MTVHCWRCECSEIEFWLPNDGVAMATGYCSDCGACVLEASIVVMKRNPAKDKYVYLVEDYKIGGRE